MVNTALLSQRAGTALSTLLFISLSCEERDAFRAACGMAKTFTNLPVRWQELIKEAEKQEKHRAFDTLPEDEQQRIQQALQPRKKGVDTSSLIPDPAQLAKEQSQGAMVALMLDPVVAEKLALPGCIVPEELHITLAFLGDKEQLESSSKPIIANITPLLAKIAEAQQGPIVGKTTGNVKHFPASDEGLVPVYAEVQFDNLVALQKSIQEAALASGAPAPTYPFTPHITLAYTPSGVPLPAKQVEKLSLNFSAFTLMYAGSRYDFSFNNTKYFLNQETKSVEEKQVKTSVLYQHFVKQLAAHQGVKISMQGAEKELDG